MASEHRVEDLLIHTGRERPLHTLPARRRQLARLRRGAYVHDAAWDALFAEDRLRVRTRAICTALRHDRWTLTHVTAAAQHGLPLYRVRDDRVDVALAPEARRHNAADIRRHHVPLPDADVVNVGGIRVTTLDRTVYDVIRTVSLEAAVVVFDAALHRVAWDSVRNEYDIDAASAFRAKIRARVSTHPGARGIKQARLVTDFTDGRAGSPRESVSRLWMSQLGVPAPDLQVRVALHGGRYALLDFAWPMLRKWGEFDGEIKYTDPRILAGRSREQVLAAQAERQAAVAEATGWRCERWGTNELEDVTVFARFLRSTGLLPGPSVR